MAPDPEDDLPKIVLDEEDRDAYKRARANQNGKKKPTKTPDEAPAPKRGGSLFALLLALIACGAAGFLYYLNLQQQQVIQASERRISELERRLSATGEEMGESTVALQVKVKELGAKADELWDQMDKLWASAWRRNQKEINDLSTLVSEQNKARGDRIRALETGQNESGTQLSVLREKLEAQANEMLTLAASIEQVNRGSSDQRQRVTDLLDSLAVLDQRNTALAGRLTQLEQRVSDQQTQRRTTPPPPRPTTTPPATTNPSAGTSTTDTQ